MRLIKERGSSEGKWRGASSGFCKAKLQVCWRMVALLRVSEKKEALCCVWGHLLGLSIPESSCASLRWLTPSPSLKWFSQLQSCSHMLRNGWIFLVFSSAKAKAVMDRWIVYHRGWNILPMLSAIFHFLYRKKGWKIGKITSFAVKVGVMLPTNFSIVYFCGCAHK